VVVLCLGLMSSPSAAARSHIRARHPKPTTPSVLSPYFGAPFTATQLAYTFGQAPSWPPNGDVLSIAFDSAGIYQIYRSHLNGSGQVCLTCATVTGPNGVPQERSEKDWILFESYGQQPIHVGNPGLGGYGADLYVMHPDGTHVYRLTTNSDPEYGAQFGELTGTPYDNFHAYWSPDGKQIVWSHTMPLRPGGATLASTTCACTGSAPRQSIRW
jgi:Tol biopolymer transport system component